MTNEQQIDQDRELVKLLRDIDNDEYIEISSWESRFLDKMLSPTLHFPLSVRQRNICQQMINIHNP